METQTAFDLNLAIQRWREDLARSTAFQNENLNELESHLRDSIDRLRTSQLSAEEAFLIATRRIGPSRQLEAEFGKLNRGNLWLGRAMWMLIGIQVWPTIDRLMSGIAGYLFVFGWRNKLHGGTWLIFFSALIQLPAFFIAVWLTWKVLKNSARVSQWIIGKLHPRSSFVLCCVAASLLALLSYAFVAFVPAGWYKLSGFAAISIVDESRTFILPVRLIGFAILTLLLARKQFVPEKA
jgi:hypothetical protein